MVNSESKVGKINVPLILLVLQTLVFAIYLKSINYGKENISACPAVVANNSTDDVITTEKKLQQPNTTAFVNESSSLPLFQFEKGRKGITITYPNETQLAIASKNKRLCSVKSRVIFINYGSHGDYFRRQNVSCRSALEYGAAACVSFTPDFLDDDFKAKNHPLLNYGLGAGLWLWKPYIVFHALLAMQPGDYLFYLDSDWDLVSSFNPYICFIHQNKLEVVPFYQSFPEYEWTKADAFFLMNLENVPNVAETAQPRGGFFFIRRTPRSLRYVGEWLTYAQDPRILSNGGSSIKKDHKDFKQNRHDQTVWSLLSKKWNLTVFPDPMLPWRRDFIQSYIGPERNILLKAYNPINVDLPNHPVDALIHNCPPNC